MWLINRTFSLINLKKQHILILSLTCAIILFTNFLVNNNIALPAIEYILVRRYSPITDFTCYISENKIINSLVVLNQGNAFGGLGIRLSNISSEMSTFSSSQILEYLRNYSGYYSVLEKKNKDIEYLYKN